MPANRCFKLLSHIFSIGAEKYMKNMCICMVYKFIPIKNQEAVMISVLRLVWKRLEKERKGFLEFVGISRKVKDQKSERKEV